MPEITAEYYAGVYGNYIQVFKRKISKLFIDEEVIGVVV